MQQAFGGMRAFADPVAVFTALAGIGPAVYKICRSLSPGFGGSNLFDASIPSLRSSSFRSWRFCIVACEHPVWDRTSGDLSQDAFLVSPRPESQRDRAWSRPLRYSLAIGVEVSRFRSLRDRGI